MFEGIPQIQPQPKPDLCQHGNSRDLCEVCNKLKDENEGKRELFDVAPEDWRTNKSLAGVLKVDDKTTKKIANRYRESNLEYFKSMTGKKGKKCEYYSPELVDIIRKEIKKTEKAPDGWINNGYLSEELGVSNQSIKAIADSYKKSNPEYFKEYVTPRNIKCLHYSPGLVELIKKEVLRRKEIIEAPEGWMTRHELLVLLKINDATINRKINKYRSEHPEWFSSYYKRGTLREHFSPELVKLLSDLILSRENPPEGWLAFVQLAEKFKVDRSTIDKLVDEYRESNPEWFRRYISKPGITSEHFSPQLVLILKEKLSDREKASDGWLAAATIANSLGIDWETVKKIAEDYKKSNPEWFKYLLTAKGKFLEHYSPDMIELIKKEINSREKAPEGWMINKSLAESLGSTKYIVKGIANKYRKSNPEYFKEYVNSQKAKYLHYSPELIELIKKEICNSEEAEEGWKLNTNLANELDVALNTTKRIAERYRESNPEYFREMKSRVGIKEYYSPELVEIITKEIKKRKENTNGNYLEDKLNILLNGIEENNPENKEVQKVREIMGLFPEKACDILYKYHPEFRGLSVDYVKSVIAEYLGDFLLQGKRWKFEDIELTAELMSDNNFSGDIYFKLKDASFAFYHEQKNNFPGMDEYEIIQKYLNDPKLLEMAEKFEEVGKAVKYLNEYYRSMFLEFRKPDNMIDGLKEGRKFPDINQLINIKELKDNKKMLIADDMGLGKSASVIMAKEYLECSCALIIAPSNVISTWENYLSSKKDKNGKKVGYFKENLAPKVLTIENYEDLEKTKSGVWDYVLISQEKLNEKYTQDIKSLNYDMLIVDEVHKLKNIEGGIRAQNIIELSEKISGDGKYLALLSGTPIPNKIKDLAISLKLLYPEKFEKVDDKQLVQNIIRGDIIDLRSLLIPRMQMKSKEGIEMPKLEEDIIKVEMSEEEREIYSMLLEEDELVATEKIQALRKFLLNPELLEMIPGMKSSKIETLKTELEKSLQEHDKIVVFVNGYIDGVIRDKDGVNIIKSLDIPDSSVKIIEGKVTEEERDRIQKSFNNDPGKTVLFVSGQTADVGVDFSGAQRVFFYNEPWSQYDKKQQLGRVYREGIKDDLKCTTIITENSLEEGINYFIRLKERAVERLLKGIPRTEIENSLLRKDEKRSKDNLEVDPELAKYYLSSWDKLLRFFGSGREIGEKEFVEFLAKHGKEYANSYVEMGSRTYQGNNSRATATILRRMMDGMKLDEKNAKVLDIASGPEMLKNHSLEKMQSSIFSTDINPHHFIKNGGRAVVSSFLNIPFKPESLDFVNLSLAMHYTKFVPSKKIFERVKLLEECNKILKTGGVALVSEMYSLDFKNENEFRNIINKLGFEIVEDYSGTASSAGCYDANFIALKKKGQSILDIKSSSRDIFEGLKFVRNDRKIKNSRTIIGEFTLNGKNIKVDFNNRDRAIYQEEQEIIKMSNELIKNYGKIGDIPGNEIVKENFSRIRIGKNYSLFKKMGAGGGYVLIKNGI